MVKVLFNILLGIKKDVQFKWSTQLPRYLFDHIKVRDLAMIGPFSKTKAFIADLVMMKRFNFAIVLCRAAHTLSISKLFLKNCTV